MKRWMLLAVCVGVGAPATAQDEVRLDQPLVIQGKVQKPEVLVTVSRRNLDKGFTLDLKESFLSRIVKALESAPF
jgi:hypothetical protein